MTIADALNKYVREEVNAIATIRLLSGMFDPVHAPDILAVICAITRIEEGDLDKETFRKMMGINDGP
jgi:hypothetical protein